jgi:hypothetical protein
MAGDWIKMRGNLWDDPRITKLCDLTDSQEAMVVGGLYWLWAAADQHTENGCMPGLTLRQIDRKTGIAGFGAALCDIGWLRDDPAGVELVNFQEHNGSSAKRRSEDAKRKADVRKDADKPKTDAGIPADILGKIAELEKELEIEREKSKKKRGSGESATRTATRKCPDDFFVTPEMAQWAVTECPGVDAIRATEKMRDHTFKNAIVDWPGAWRNWLRKDFESLATQTSGETNYQKSMRLRVAEISPALARPAPGQLNPTAFFESLKAPQINVLEIAK